MITDWLDEVTKIWGSMTDTKGMQVKSYRVFEKAEMPEKISRWPSAISYLPRVSVMTYGASGSTLVFNGVTELHVCPDVGKANYPAVMAFYDKILLAAAGHVTLGGKVAHFLLSKTDPIVAGVLQYGTQAPGLGLVIRWEVKETAALVLGN